MAQTFNNNNRDGVIFLISLIIFILYMLWAVFGSYAADRYWVGGTDTWNTTSGSKWATTSGGAGGAAYPTSSDDVYFDGNSGTGTVTAANNVNCKSLNFSGFTGTFKHAAFGNIVNVYGSLTMGSGMTYTAGTTTFGQIDMEATSGMWNITTNGIGLGSLYFRGAGGTWTIQDNCSYNTSATSAYMATTAASGMTIDFNGKTITWPNYQWAAQAATRTTMQNLGTFYCSTSWSATSTSFAGWSPGNMKLIFTGSGAKTCTFAGNTMNYIELGNGLTAPTTNYHTFDAVGVIIDSLVMNGGSRVKLGAGVTTSISSAFYQAGIAYACLIESTASSAATISLPANTMVRNTKLSYITQSGTGLIILGDGSEAKNKGGIYISTARQ